MANLTLRQGPPGVGADPDYIYKQAPLTHAELDANFVALDSEISNAHFDSGVVVNGGGIIVDSGDVVINNGDLNINEGDFNYDAALKFVDNSNGETLRLDSNQALLFGIDNNLQNVKMKVSRIGNQHTLIGSKISNSGQTTRMELGPAGATNNTGAGLLATQTTSNFNDWSLSLFTSSATDGYVNSITIDKDGSIAVDKDITFNDSVSFSLGIDVSGDLNVSGDILNNGNPIAGGTVESVAMTVPTGLTISGSPITTSGTLAVAYDAVGGYSAGIPSDVKQAQWDEAYGWGDHSTAGYVTASQFDTLFDSAFPGTINGGTF